MTEAIPSTMRAVVVREVGDASSLTVDENVAVPTPKPFECLVRNTFAGLNFLDTYHRTGLYPRERPFVLGVEGAGVVVSIGEQVTGVKIGDRVAYNSPGSYAEFTSVPETNIIPVPDTVPLDVAVGCVVQGLTAHYLTNSTFPLKENHWALVHAGAGGTGRLVVQYAKSLGAKVIATTSTAKVDIVKALGADVVIDYTTQDVVKEVLDATQGKGVDVVYDGVGKSTFKISLNSLKPRGMCVFFGNASGPVPPIDSLELSSKSLYLARPRLPDYVATREELLERVASVFDLLVRGVLDVKVTQEFPLTDVAKSHQFLESGQSTGKLVLRLRSD
eukprot:c8125_g1_i1.p1 GENE.c8125_g1_i1~~c8125_g1_i1.p1  ORF type:complete len:332 (-),score=71.23 c8125_g1_i1:127-1122(-)